LLRIPTSNHESRPRLLTFTEPTPDEKAAEIINKVPSSSLWTKTGGIILGTGVAAAAVSSELYVSCQHV